MIALNSSFDDNQPLNSFRKDEQPKSIDDLILESKEVNLQQLKEDRPNDFAFCKLPGAVFAGILKDGKRKGPGVMKYSNGRQYEGLWIDDVRHGKGFERYPGGNSYFGDFVKGKAHGQGVFKWANGQEYDG